MSLASRVMVFAVLSLLADLALAASVGVLIDARTPYYEKVASTFERSIRASRPNVSVTVGWSGADQIARRNTVRRFVASGFDVIVAIGRGVGDIAVEEADRTPLLVTGHQLSPPRERRGVLGLIYEVPAERLVSRLKMLRSTTSVVVVAHVANNSDVEILSRAVRSAGMTAQTTDVRADVTGLAGAHAIVFVASGAPGETERFAAVAETAKTMKVPLLTTLPGGETSGALLSLYVDGPWMATQVAAATARVISGATVEIKRPLTPCIVFALNTNVAKALGLQVGGAATEGTTLIAQ